MFQLRHWLRNSSFVVLALLLVACQTSTVAAPATVEVIVTQEVEVEVTRVVEVSGETVVQEVVVTATPEPETGVTLPLESIRIPATVRMNHLDPAGPSQLTQNIVLNFICGKLYLLNTDFSAKPELAEALPEFSEDGLTATIPLKDGLTFADGSPLVAQDVVFSLERVLTNETAPWRASLVGIESVEAPDDRTVVLHLTAPNVALTTNLGHPGACVFPQAQVEADPDFFSKAPVGAGQYVLEAWTPADTEWTLVENPNYALGPSAVRQIDFVVVADPTSRVLQLTTGALDYAYDVPVAARNSFPPEVQTYVSPLGGVYMVAFNYRLPADHPLMNADVRKAMSLAINREEVTQKAFGGISPPSVGFQYQALIEADPALAVLPNGGQQDLEAARALLATTPFADGFEFTLQTWSTRAGWADAALVISENLAEIGIIANVQPLDEAIARNNLRSGTFEADFSGNTGDSLSLLRGWFAPGGGLTVQMGYDNAELAGILNAASSAASAEERVELIREASLYAANEMGVIPISDRVVLVGQRVPRSVVYEDNRPPANNVTVNLLADAE